MGKKIFLVTRENDYTEDWLKEHFPSVFTVSRKSYFREHVLLPSGDSVSSVRRTPQLEIASEIACTALINTAMQHGVSVILVRHLESIPLMYAYSDLGVRWGYKIFTMRFGNGTDIPTVTERELG